MIGNSPMKNWRPSCQRWSTSGLPSRHLGGRTHLQKTIQPEANRTVSLPTRRCFPSLWWIICHAGMRCTDMATKPSQVLSMTSSPLSRSRRRAAKGRRVKLTVHLSTVSSSKFWIPSIMPPLQTENTLTLPVHSRTDRVWRRTTGDFKSVRVAYGEILLIV